MVKKRLGEKAFISKPRGFYKLRFNLKKGYLNATQNAAPEFIIRQGNSRRKEVREKEIAGTDRRPEQPSVETLSLWLGNTRGEGLLCKSSVQPKM